MKKHLTMLAILASGLLLTACPPAANNAGGGNAPANTAANNTANNNPPEDNPPAFDQGKARDEVVAKAWDYLKTMYDKPAAPDDRAGIKSGWGPKSMNVPYTGLVLQGLVGTKVWDANNEMIRASMDWLVQSQEPTGSWSYMPGVEQVKGLRAVYITAICAQLFAEVNKLDGPWKGKLNNEIAKARDYLKQSQVGQAEGPAPDYDRNKAGFGGWAYSKEEIGKSVGQEGKPASNMSTTTFAIDALKACGLSESDPVWQDALVFLKRNQNAGEVQDEGFEAIDKATGKKIKMAGKDSPDYGGAIYSEETSKADGGTENADGTITLFSYGSMTYNLLRAYLFAGLKKDSVPVKLAFGWVQRNYTMERVPGFRDEKQYEMGLYYYYMSVGKTLNAFGEATIEEADRGLKHNWREDLTKALQKRQKEDGSWVNSNSRFQENSPVLCTAYALEALRNTK